MEKRKLTVASFRKMKANKEKIVMVTAYDAPGAEICAGGIFVENNGSFCVIQLNLRRCPVE